MVVIFNVCVMNISDDKTDPTNVISTVGNPVANGLPDIYDKQFYGHLK